MPYVVIGVAVLAALAAALVGGVFYAFSSFVMRALGRLPPAQGIAAMQSINVTAVQPPLMIAFVGTLLVGIAACVVAAVAGVWPTFWWAIAGCAVYLVGVIGMTGGFHVPRNNALDKLDPSAPASAASWSTYLSQWTAGNHVRVLGGLVSGAAFTVGALLV
jgi:uncharacterized membrane protein